MTNQQKKDFVDGFVEAFEAPDEDGVSVGIGDLFEGCETYDEKYEVLRELQKSMAIEQIRERWIGLG